MIEIDHRDKSSIYPDMMKTYVFECPERLTLAKTKFGNILIGTENMSAGKKAKWLVKKIIFNPPATIIFWTDGTKTVVKAHKEPFDPEKGIAMAFFKKFVGVHGKCSHATVMREMMNMSEIHLSEEHQEQINACEEFFKEFESQVFGKLTENQEVDNKT